MKKDEADSPKLHKVEDWALRTANLRILEKQIPEDKPDSFDSELSLKVDSAVVTMQSSEYDTLAYDDKSDA